VVAPRVEARDRRVSWTAAQSADAAVTETADGSGHAPTRTSVDVDSLDYCELAVALYAADISVGGRRKPRLDELKGLAAQGVDRIGLARVRYIAEETRRLNLDMLAQSARGEDTAWWFAATRRLWPSPDREKVAIALAYSLIMRRPARNERAAYAWTSDPART
jgi:hypothetical protein